MRIQPLLLLALIFFGHAAQADWTVTGVATRCDPNGAVFEVAPVVELSSPDAGEVPVEEGYKRLPEGTSKLRCTLANSTVHAIIHVSGPADHGECMGAGYVAIEQLLVGDARVSLVHNESFNWHCIYDPILVRIAIHQSKSKNTFEKCTAKKWEWGKGFSSLTCVSTDITPN